ncbi:MAG TPA: NAD(P)/FAD-dependent oxidoreductase [Longimicrobiales bacterium]|nr:NAD(P)/FAD-dependent oxidoreductase [Longimicrobiales bacterium]
MDQAVSAAEPRDITIIGGGPTGLFAAFYAGMRGVSARIVDSMPELGGQLAALYPEKYVYDVGGFPQILARDLAARCIEQGLQFGADVRLEEQIDELIPEADGSFTLTTDRGRYPTKAIVIAAGKGAFAPRVLECAGYERLVGRGVTHHVKDPAHYEGKRVLIVGGGDSAVDWALNLKDRTRRLILIHRREGFRAHAHSMRLMQQAVEAGQMELLTHREVREIHGDEIVTGVTIFDNRSDADTHFEVDAVLALIGFKPDLGPISRWGLELERHSIRVDPHMQTTIPGVFAAGDICTYDGKLELIATGFSEACIAVNYAVHHIDPKARINPGHSTNLKVFKDREEETVPVAG